MLVQVFASTKASLVLMVYEHVPRLLEAPWCTKAPSVQMLC